MIHNVASIESTVRILNEALALDREAVSALIGYRVPCTKSLADHETIQVRSEDSVQNAEYFSVSALGLLNGLFGVDDLSGYGPITAVTDDAGKIERFESTDIERMRKGPVSK